MKIKEAIINYNNIPCEAELCRVTAIEPHYHSHDLELIYCLEGKVDLVVGHQKVTIHADEIYSVDFRDIHFLSSDQENLLLIFHLDLKNLSIPWKYNQHVFFSCESIHCYPYQQSAMEKVKEILLSVSYTLYNTDTVEIAPQQFVKASNDLFDILFRYFNWFNYNNQDEYINEAFYDRFHRILSYCNENYMNKITISQLAEKEHINRNYFSQFLSKTVFTSFNLMIKYLRCFEAEQLLLKTDLPVAEISFACGFSDPKYFYSAFKLWWECTPTEHRKNYAEYMKTSFHKDSIDVGQAAELLQFHMIKGLLNKTFNSF